MREMPFRACHRTASLQRRRPCAARFTGYSLASNRRVRHRPLRRGWRHGRKTCRTGIQKFVSKQEWLGEARLHTNFSKPVRLRFLVGIPDQKSGILPFSIAPIEFRLPEPADGAQIPVAQRKDPLTEALMRAKSWKAELAKNPSFRRADIARREGLTRARVTQLLTLNRIPPDALQQIRQKVAAGRRQLSIRILLGLAEDR